MPEQKKKVIPKFKKKLHGFLSDESGKITKEDVLKMGMIAMGVAGMIDSANASCSWSNTSSIVSFWTPSGNPTPVNSYYPAAISGNAPADCDATKDANQSRLSGTIYTSSSVAPYSVIVNWHANSYATIQWGGFNGGTLTTTTSVGHGSHSSHWQHWNHGSWGWC